MGAEEDATIEKSRLKISPLWNFVQIVYEASMGQGLKHHQKFSLISSLQWSSLDIEQLTFIGRL